MKRIPIVWWLAVGILSALAFVRGRSAGPLYSVVRTGPHPIVKSVDAAPAPVQADAATRRAAQIRSMVDDLLRWSEDTDDDRRTALQMKLQAALTDENAEALLKAIPPELRESFLAMDALEKWAMQTPSDALRWLATTLRATDWQLALPLRSWLQQDLAGLRDYLAGAPDGAWRQQLLSVAGYQAMSAWPDAAASWLIQLPPEKRNPAVLETALLFWARNDPEAAAVWAGGQPDAGIRDTLLTGVAIGYARRHPNEAIAFAAGKLKSSEALNRAVEGIVGVWADEHPEEVSGWVGEFPAGDIRRTGFDTLVRKWAESDPAKAERWISAQPSGEERDHALQGLALRLVEGDVMDGVRVMERIDSLKIREETTLTLLRQWALREPARARAWADSLPAGPVRDQAYARLAQAALEQNS